MINIILIIVFILLAVAGFENGLKKGLETLGLVSITYATIIIPYLIIKQLDHDKRRRNQ